jgi:hypothetical protein
VPVRRKRCVSWGQFSQPGRALLWGVTLPCSHELDSILTAIIGQSELLPGDLPPSVYPIKG